MLTLKVSSCTLRCQCVDMFGLCKAFMTIYVRYRHTLGFNRFMIVMYTLHVTIYILDVTTG